jgi:hypothetical protein
MSKRIYASDEERWNAKRLRRNHRKQQRRQQRRQQRLLQGAKIYTSPRGKQYVYMPRVLHCAACGTEFLSRSPFSKMKILCGDPQCSKARRRSQKRIYLPIARELLGLERQRKNRRTIVTSEICVVCGIAIKPAWVWVKRYGGFWRRLRRQFTCSKPCARERSNLLRREWDRRHSARRHQVGALARELRLLVNREKEDRP